MVVWGSGVGSFMGVLGWGFSVAGVWGLWCEAFWIFRAGALYINIKEQTWEKNGAQLTGADNVSGELATTQPPYCNHKVMGLG